MPTPTSDVVLAKEFKRANKRLTAATVRALVALWDGSPTDDLAGVAAWIESVLPLVRQAEAEAVRLASAYYSARLGDTAAVFANPEVAADTFAVLGAVRDGLESGAVTPTTVSEYGRKIMPKLAEQVVYRSQAEVANQVDAQYGDRVTGWRRVPSGSTCSWCVLVSTQRYQTARSASFGHNNQKGGREFCDCVPPDPIVRDSDPGRIINGPRLSQLRTAMQVDEGATAPRYLTVQQDGLTPE